MLCWWWKWLPMTGASSQVDLRDTWSPGAVPLDCICSCFSPELRVRTHRLLPECSFTALPMGAGSFSQALCPGAGYPLQGTGT